MLGAKQDKVRTHAYGMFCLPHVVGLKAVSVLTAGRDHRVRSAYPQPVHATVYTASVTTAVRTRSVHASTLHTNVAWPRSET